MSKFVVSPDGRFLAFLGAYGYIHLVSAKVTNVAINDIFNVTCFVETTKCLLPD